MKTPLISLLLITPQAFAGNVGIDAIGAAGFFVENCGYQYQPAYRVLSELTPELSRELQRTKNLSDVAADVYIITKSRETNTRLVRLSMSTSWQNGCYRAIEFIDKGESLIKK